MIDTISYSDAGILIVDAHPEAVRALADPLEAAGYLGVETILNYAEVTATMALGGLDLIILGLGLGEPQVTGLLQEIRSVVSRDDLLPVMVIGPGGDPHLGARMIEAGARDFMRVPVDAHEFILRARSLIEMRLLCGRLRDGKHSFEELLRRRTHEYQETYLELLERLGRVTELRDDPSGGHPARVGRLAGLIAQELMLPAEETRCLLRAAPLHDLGNLGVPDDIVMMEGRFTDEQRERMREHTSLGACLLEGAENSVLKMAETIALNHHERWDGFGYPQGLSHAEIPIAARIVAVADSFDAITHVGRYKEPSTVQSALDEIQREAGWQFDPEVVAALVRVHERQPGMLTITPRAPRRTTC